MRLANAYIFSSPLGQGHRRCRVSLSYAPRDGLQSYIRPVGGASRRRAIIDSQAGCQSLQWPQGSCLLTASPRGAPAPLPCRAMLSPRAAGGFPPPPDLRGSIHLIHVIASFFADSGCGELECVFAVEAPFVPPDGQRVPAGGVGS